MSGMTEIALTARYYEAETDRVGLKLARGNYVIAISIDGNEIVLPEREAREFGEWLKTAASGCEKYSVSEVYWGHK